MNVSPRLFALVPAAVAINLVVGRVVAELGLPVYLDTLGTMLVAVLAGLGGGLLVGTLSQILSGLLGGFTYFPFTPIQWLVALLATLAARRGGFRDVPRTIGWGLTSGLACGMLSAPISYFLFGGITTPGMAAVVTLLQALGFSNASATGTSSILSDMVDKTAAFLAVGTLLRALPKRILGRFALAARAVGK